MILASAGTISLLEIVKIPTTFMMIFGSLLLFIGVAGETGVAPFMQPKQRCSELLVPPFS